MKRATCSFRPSEDSKKRICQREPEEPMESNGSCEFSNSSNTSSLQMGWHVVMCTCGSSLHVGVYVVMCKLGSSLHVVGYVVMCTPGSRIHARG